MTVQNERRNQKKNEIIETMQQYRDEHGNIDLGRLRKEDRSTYNLISYYFVNIDNALIAAGSSNSEYSKEVAKGAPVNRKTLRNELAYDMLAELRGKHTLEEIAQRYGCSRAHVNQLFQSLSNSVGALTEKETSSKTAE